MAVDAVHDGAAALEAAAQTVYDVVLERLIFIRHTQPAGLALQQIRQVLDNRDSGQPPCAHVTGLNQSRRPRSRSGARAARDARRSGRRW